MRVAAIIAAWALAVAAPAAAQLREPVTAESEVDAAEPGQTIRVFGAGWERGSTVNVGLRGHGAQPLVTDAQGRFDGPIEIPEEAEPGETELLVSGTDERGEPAELSMPFRVVEGAPRGALVPVLLVALGIAAVLAVAAFLILRARRRALEPTGSV